MRRLALALGLAGALAGGYAVTQQDPYIITWEPGGRLDEHYERFVEIRQSGRPVRVDGMCLSACTFLVGLIPHERVCATPNAILGFHSASLVSMLGEQHSSEGTRLIWQTYPERVQQILIERGWNGDPEDHREKPEGNAHPEMIYIRAPEIYQIWSQCD